MTTKLPSGLVIFNGTPHPLYLWTGEEVVVAPPDESINVRNEFTEPVSCGLYSTMQSHDYRTLRGRQIIRELRETQPDTLIIGSFIAARVYKGDIVSVLKLKPKPEKYGTDLPLISSDIFVIHLGD